MRFAAGLLVGATLYAQDLSTDELLLARIKAHMAATLKRQPNYTCLETVERTQRPKGGRAGMVDTLRLEVAIVDGKEMFAWPGSKKFEDKDIEDMVSGTFGNGNFSIFARAVFTGSAPTFQPYGQTMLNGRRAVRYDYRVPQFSSGFTMKVNRTIEAVVGYRGSFWADADTLDVIRLDVIAEDIPKRLRVDGSMDRMEYRQIPIGGENFLLPYESVMELNTPDADYRNFMRFTNCRQYSGESVLKFTEEVSEDSDPSAPQEAKEIQLVKGDQLSLALTEALDLSKAAVGDEISATLNADLKRKRELIVPKGAVARGRIARLERRPDHMLLGLRFLDLEWSDKHAAIPGTIDHVNPQVDAKLDPRRIPFYEAPKGEGLIRMPATQQKLIRGMLVFWRIEF